MTERSHRKRWLLVTAGIVGAFVIGAVVGALMTSAGASRNTQLAISGARYLFVYDQRERLALAWNANDMNAALAHAQCAYEAEFADGARWFDPRATGGDWFLQTAVKTNRAYPIDKGKELAHGQIAVVLERLGRVQEAQEHLAEAAKADGREPAWWRTAALKTIGAIDPEGFLHPDGSVRR